MKLGVALIPMKDGSCFQGIFYKFSSLKRALKEGIKWSGRDLHFYSRRKGFG